MPTKEYKNPTTAWQALTDQEIEDDSREIPVAVIRVPGIGKIRITMLSEYDYFYHFQTARNMFITYYANKIATDENIKDNEIILNKLKAFQNEITQTATEGGAPAEAITYLFSDAAARFEFFKLLKKIRLIKWHVSWNKWQKRVRVLDTMTIFCWLWLFNVDAVKKNAKFLIDRISRVMITASPTESKVFTDLESFKKAHQAARARDPWLMSQRNSNN